MDHPWRHRPPPPFQGKICPICSTSHFPFCPPHPPSFNQNPIFQPHISHSLQRPFFDQFVDHQGPPGNLHRPFIGDRFGDPRPWYRSPSLDYEQFHGQSQVGDPATVNGGYGDGFPPSRYDHGGVGFKRTRDDEMDAGLFTSDNRMYWSRISSENERRLKLIRDHGIVASGSLQGGANTVSGTGMDFNREAKEYVQENSVFDRNFGNIDGSECRRLDELRGGRNDMTLKLPSNFEMNDFRDLGFGHFHRNGKSFHPELGFNPNNYREEAFGQQNMQNYSKEEIGQSRYGQGEDSLHPSLQANGHTDHAAGHSTNVEQGRQSQDVATLYGEGCLQPNPGSGGSYLFASQGDLNKQLHNSQSQSVPYPISEAPNENYYRQRFLGAHPSDSLSAKEPQYSHLVSRQGWSASSAPHNEPGSFAMENPNSNRHMPQPYTMQHAMQPNHDFHSHGQLNDGRQSYEVNLPSHKGNQDPVGHQNMPPASQYGPRNLNKQGGYVPVHTGGSIVSEYRTLMQTSGVFNVQPPLPVYPPPSLTAGSAGHPLSEALAFSSPPKTSSSLFPIPVSSTATVPSSYAPIHEAHSLAQPYLHLKSHLHASTSFATEEFQTIKQTSSRKYMGEGQPFPLISSDKRKSIDASHIFKQPHRATRPDHIVIILRGLPGSGKSYLAKMLRDLEVENGGDAPRIHSIDDYFMIEVEKVEESDVSKSSGLVRGKKPIMKKVMEYCYEPEMEEAYRSSMLKAFKKTLDDSVFSFVIVDDRNLRVADFAQFWATAKRSGYEVYLLEATYKDPAGCAARNVHGFTQDDIQKMARQWEEAPSLYLKLDIKSLFHGEDLKESGIQEVDMDIEDGDAAGTLSGLEERSSEKITVPPLRDISPDGSLRVEKKWDAEGDHPREEVKELGGSKWSDDLDDDNTKRSEANKGNLNALSGLIKAYTKEGKSVHWGDQVGNTGFSIGAARKVNVSLVIGPGAGYNFKSNPLPEDHASTQNTGESKRQSIFQERIRAEHESFRVVFDKRRQRIGGLDLEVE